MDIIKGRPDSWTLHRHAAASGHNVQAFLLEKSKSWANDTIFQMQKMLTKRYCAATTVIISCRFKAGEMRSAMNIEKRPKQQIAQPQRRQKESLRMRQDVPAETIKPHEETNGPESDRKAFQDDPKVKSCTFAKPLPTIHEQATNTLPTTTADNTPLCRGLVHRTEAGWKHCAERSAGTGSKRSSTDALKDTGEQKKEHVRDQDVNLLNDDQYKHFYYFDGVLRRVRHNFYPYYRRQRRQKRSPGNTENSVHRVRNRGDTQENVLAYIRRLTSENKAGHFK
ncbi:hypothetical protein VZT92_009706 [Zoarces viviparus]|uniref:Uncharacterized protein n=1 Tax=Zoarces viviparus TaxID=48416 RepID=A0AAW1FD52_ZOAVI